MRIWSADRQVRGHDTLVSRSVILTAPHGVGDDRMAVRAVLFPDGETESDIDAVSNAVGIPSNLMRAVLHRESAGKRRAVSSVGARGLMQIMPGTFRLYARRIEAMTGCPADINDPLDNLVAGGLHLRDDLDATQGNIRAAAERYFAGPDPRRHGRRSTIYGNAILQHFAQLEASARGS